MRTPNQLVSVGRRICRDLVALILTALAAPGATAAEERAVATPTSAPLRALVWLQPDTDDVLTRIRGQTNDLRVELLVDVLDSIPGDMGAQLRMASNLSQQQDASLVIWFVKQPAAEPHFIVNIALPKTSRLLTRDVGPCAAVSDGGGLSSAVKESAALVVRAAIQAVLSGSTIGELRAARFDSVREPQTSEQTAPTLNPATPNSEENHGPERDTPHPPRQPRIGPAEAELEAPQPQSVSSRSTDWPWALGVEWLPIYDGAKGHPLAECAQLRAERRVQWFRAFVDASSCLRREIDANSYGRFLIARQAAALGVNLILLRTGLEASVGAQAGAVFYERTTVPSPGAWPSKTHVMGTAGPEFRLLVPARGSRFQAGFVLGLDIVTNSLRIGYTDPAAPPPEHFTQIAQLSVVQPYAALGLAFRL